MPCTARYRDGATPNAVFIAKYIHPAYHVFLADFGPRSTPSRRIFHTVRSLRIERFSRAQYLRLIHIERRFKCQIVPTIRHAERFLLSTLLTKFVFVETNDQLHPTRIGYGELYLTQQPHPTITIGLLNILEENFGVILDE